MNERMNKAGLKVLLQGTMMDFDRFNELKMNQVWCSFYCALLLIEINWDIGMDK